MARHSGGARPSPDTRADGLPAGRGIALVVLGGSVAAFALLVGGPSTGPVALSRDLVLFNVAHLATAALCWWPRAVTARARRAWRVLAVAVVVSAAGNVGFTLAGSAVVGDLLYLAAYPVMNVAAILLVRERGRYVVPAVWLDGLVIGLSAAALTAALVPAPLLRLEPSAPITNLAYPVADLSLLVLLATVGGAVGPRLDRRLALLGLGLGLTFVTDLAYVLAELSQSYHEGNPLDLGWLLALLPIAAAAAGRWPSHRFDAAPLTAPIQRAAVAAPTAAALAALAVLVVGYYADLPPAAGGLAGAALLVALMRACLTVHQLKALPEARRQARTDPLTELANRRHLQERCARLLTHADAAPVTLLMIDLDGFKVINDRHGHPVGDALLVEVAARLAATMRRDDLLGRLGGDEFAAILPRTTPLQARAVAQRIHAALAAPIAVAGHALHVDASVGVSAAGRPGMPTATLFHEADTAMYRAKRSRMGTAIAARRSSA
jgi:diguanylate cyclase